MGRQFRSIKGKMLLVFAGLVMLLTIASAGPLDESGCKKLGLVEEFDSFVQVRLLFVLDEASLNSESGGNVSLPPDIPCVTRPDTKDRTISNSNNYHIRYKHF